MYFCCRWAVPYSRGILMLLQPALPTALEVKGLFLNFSLVYFIFKFKSFNFLARQDVLAASKIDWKIFCSKNSLLGHLELRLLGAEINIWSNMSLVWQCCLQVRCVDSEPWSNIEFDAIFTKNNQKAPVFKALKVCLLSWFTGRVSSVSNTNSGAITSVQNAASTAVAQAIANVSLPGPPVGAWIVALDKFRQVQIFIRGLNQRPHLRGHHRVSKWCAFMAACKKTDESKYRVWCRSDLLSEQPDTKCLHLILVHKHAFLDTLLDSQQFGAG